MANNKRVYYTDVRCILFYMLREQGLTYREIGERAGISTSRAMQIVKRCKRLMNHPSFHDRKFSELANAARLSIGVGRDEIENDSGAAECLLNFDWPIN